MRMIRVSVHHLLAISEMKQRLSNSKPRAHTGAIGLLAVSGAAAATASGQATATDATVASDQSSLASIEVTGTAIQSGLDQPQSISTIDPKELAEQNLTLLQDALRNVPGITLNSGEGGSHGDSVNLRGLSIPDSFFLDGVRDIGQYQRDTFNSEAISVLLGPASAVFGRGSTAGVINSISKQPLLSPLVAVAVSAGQADYWRGTADLNLPLAETTAARLAVMDQRNAVAERDQVLYRRYGVAPTLAFGIDTATRLTLSYFKEEENNIPDYGIPFIDGAPAHVDRSNYYGLINYDRTRTNTNIGTLRVQHDISDSLTISDSLRYENVGFEYLLDASFLGNDYAAPPPTGTPYSAIEVSRDQPSSAGTTSLLINRTDLTSRFDVAGFRNSLTGGVELSKEQSHVNRFENGLDDIPATPLLAPDAFHTPPTPLISYSNPKGEGKDVSFYALDNIAIDPRWDIDLGLRWDRFKTRFSEPFTASAFGRTDTFVSPRIAVIYKPTDAQSYYLSYGTSYNPAIEYLVIAPSNNSLSPEKNSALELGAKVKILDARAELTGAVFDTFVKNVRNSDPNDPTVQDAPYNQRVKGVELGIDGYITSIWEVKANYSHLDDKITATTDTLSQGKLAPNTPHDAANVWSIVEPTHALSLGGGFTAVSHRYADTENTAGVPGYVVFNAMVSYEFSERFKVQLNLNNVTDKLYFTGIYYTGTAENHALPSPARTVLGIASYRF